MNKTYHPIIGGFLLLFCLCFSFLLTAQNGDIPNNIAEIVTEESRPDWMELNPDTDLDAKNFINLLTEGNGAGAGTSYDYVSSKADPYGRTHIVYQKNYKNIPIDGNILLLHEENDKLVSAQGSFLQARNNPVPSPQLDGLDALRGAFNATSAIKYAWEDSDLEAELKTITGNPNATYYPESKLVWLEDRLSGELELVYKVEVQSVEPLSKKRYYINAKTGQVEQTVDLLYTGCFEPTHEHHNHSSNHKLEPNVHQSTSVVVDSESSGKVNYVNDNGGIMDSVITDFNGTDYTLNTSSYGPLNQVINTYDANKTPNYGSTTNFVDGDNYWGTDSVAYGAHWGAQRTYDYFLNVHGRHSLDGNGMPITTVVHYRQFYNSDYNNAFWLSPYLVLGDGDGTRFNAFSSLDLMGHEFAHGVTENNGHGGLYYGDESGALNESFSDIFAVAIEFLYHPDGGDWLVGEDFTLQNSQSLRNFENPNLNFHPKAYLGKYWYDGSGDYGGVHSNSSVQNHWFYLLVEGGTGTNEFGQAYDITPIGLEKASAIAYYTLTNYMTTYATYQNARTYSMDAALFLYDAATQAIVEEAWCAVGLGPGCGPTLDVEEPILNEVISAGKDYTIMWTDSLIPPTAKVKLEYSTDPGYYPRWTFITDNVDNDGSYEWEVSADYSTTVRIRISDDGDSTKNRASNSDIFSVSDFFSIDACINQNSFTGPTTVPINEAIQFTGDIPGDSYEWKIDGNQVATTTDYSHTFTDYGIYDLTYFIDTLAKGCTNEETKRIYVLNENSYGFSTQLGTNGNSTTAHSQEILQTADGGYVFGSVFPAKLIKIDSDGNFEWTTDSIPEPPYPNYRLKAAENTNGDIIVAVSWADTTSSRGDDNLMILEIDGTDGSFISNNLKQFGLAGELIPAQIVVTDTSYIIGGEYENGSTRELFLLHLRASNFSIINQYWTGGDNIYDYYGELLPTSDGGFLFGFMQQNTPQSYAFKKLDKNFQEEWKVSHRSPTMSAYAYSRMKIVEIPNCEGYMVLADENTNFNSALLKMNNLGNVLWAKRYAVPDALDLYYFAFHNMVWDGNDGVTLMGVNVVDPSATNGVDYHLLNVDFDGQMRWKRKMDHPKLRLPTNPSYNLYVADLISTADGGYMAALPGGAGNLPQLIKMDSMGMDGCLMTNSEINESALPSPFVSVVDFVSEPGNEPIIQSVAPLNLPIRTKNITVPAPKCGIAVGNTVTAAFSAKSFHLLKNIPPVINNVSIGATTYVWKVDGVVTSFPLPAFAYTGVYEVTLETSDGVNTSSVTHIFNVVNGNGCQLACDLLIDDTTITQESCPNSSDGEIEVTASSINGLDTRFELYDNNDILLTSQSSGLFTGLTAGTYEVKAISISDDACFVETGALEILPTIDNITPTALCLTDTIEVAFVHAAEGVPFNTSQYYSEMDGAFGVDDWHELLYETVNPNLLFSDNYTFIHLEGTYTSSNGLKTFLAANQQLIEDWVAAGNSLFLNAGVGNGITSIDFGFGGVQVVLNPQSDAIAVDPSLTYFLEPDSLNSTSFSGTISPYSYGEIIYPNSLVTTRILESPNGTDLLVEATWGDGKVIFGGINSAGYHTNQTNSIAFKKNIFEYLSDLPAAAKSPVKITLDENQSYSLTGEEVVLAYSDECGIMSLDLDNSEFDCADLGELDVVVTITDVGNNEATCITSIEIIGKIQTDIDITICQGQSYSFKGGNFSTSGEFRDTVVTANECDSIYVLNLTVLDTFHTEITESICAGDSLLFNGAFRKTAGEYRDTIESLSNGCDSFIVLTLNILDTFHTEIAESICAGDSLLFNGNQLKIAGEYRDTMDSETIGQCDSFIILNLTVWESSETTLTERICPDDFYTFKGENLTEGGIYRDTLEDVNLCDSIVILNLIIDTARTILEATICQGESYEFANETYTETGTYSNTLMTSSGCDSIVLLNLTVEECFGCMTDTLLITENPVPKGRYQAAMAIESETEIMADVITYQAGECITLKPGFEASSGSEFHAYIEPTTCDEPSAMQEEPTESSATQRDRKETLDKFTKNALAVSPNPFHQTTKIEFSLGTAQEINLSVYSAEGRLVKTLQKGLLNAGNYTQLFDSEQRSGGLFIVVLRTEKAILTKKIVRLE